MKTRVRKIEKDPYRDRAQKYRYDKRPLGAIEVRKIVWIPVLVIVAAIALLSVFLVTVYQAGEGEGKAIESIDTFLYDDTSYEEYEKQEELMEDENHEETKSTIPSEKGTHHVEDH